MQIIVGKQNILTYTWTVTGSSGVLVVSNEYNFDLIQGMNCRCYDITTGTTWMMSSTTTFTSSFSAGKPIYTWTFTNLPTTATSDTLYVYLTVDEYTATTLALQYLSSSPVFPSIPGLLAQYDITNASGVVQSGNKISQVIDLTGNGHTLNQATGAKKPDYIVSDTDNGKPALHIQSTEFINTAFAQALPYTLYIYVKIPTGVNNNQIIGLGTGIATAVVQRTSSITGLYYNGFASGSNFQPVAVNFMNKTGWCLLRYTLSGTGNLSYSINNEPIQGNDSRYFQLSTGTTAMTNYIIGDNNGASPNFFYQEGLVISGVTNDATHALIVAYFTGKYAPAVSNKLLISFGDSITTGSLATDPINQGWGILVSQNKGYDWIDYGISGTTVGYNQAFNSSSFDGLYNTVEMGTNRNGYITVSYGANDPTVDNGWGDFVNTRIQYLMSLGYTAGQIVLVSELFCPSGLFPNIDLAAAQLKRIALANGYIYAPCWEYGVAHQADGLISGTGPHPNTAGHAAMATVIESVLP